MRGIALDAGARIIGGCCGTSAEHLAAMRRALEAHVPQQRPTVAVVEQRLGEVSALAKGHDAAASAGKSGSGGGARERRCRNLVAPMVAKISAMVARKRGNCVACR